MPPPEPPPGTRPVDPDAECLGGGPDVTTPPPAQRRLAPQEVWGVADGAGVLVAVVGSGVDATHPQLTDQVERGVDVVVPGAFGDADCAGAGTALAGLLVARPLPDIGVHGVAPGARVLPVRVTGDGVESTPDLVAAGIDAAVAAGARVVLVAIPLPTGSARLSDAIAVAVAADVLVVAPAEPLPNDVPGVSHPAADERVIAVNALDGSGQVLDRPSEERVVDLVAPGEGVLAPLPGRGHTSDLTGPGPAAAYVAGAAALVWSAHPELTATDVRHRLELTADHAATVPDAAAGWGTVNPAHAVTAQVPPTPPTPVAPPAEHVAGPAPPPPPDRTLVNRALWIALGGAVAALALLVAVRVVPSGRARSWRPGRGSQAVPR